MRTTSCEPGECRRNQPRLCILIPVDNTLITDTAASLEEETRLSLTRSDRKQVERQAEAALPMMIRVTCNTTGDTAFVVSPEDAVGAAVQLNEDAGRANGYRSFSFHEAADTGDYEGDLIRTVNGAALYETARSLA